MACGQYWISNQVVDDVFSSIGGRNRELSMPRRAILAHQLRIGLEVPQVDRGRADGSRIACVSGAYIEKLLADAFQLPSPPDQSRNLMRLIGDRERRSGQATHTEGWFSAEIGAPSAAYVGQYIQELSGLGLIHKDYYAGGEDDGLAGLSLTLRGWREWEEITKGHRGGTGGFIAMQFGDPKLDKFVDEVVKRGMKDLLGITIERVDDNPTAGLIDNRMRQLIQDAAFVLADLTHANAGAYWEAGYAEGLGKPVIYLCEKAVFNANKTHFDVNHCMTVTWSEHEPAEAIAQLAATIRNSLPRS